MTTGPHPDEHRDVNPGGEGGVHDGTLEQPPFAGRGLPNTIVGADRVLARKAFTMTPSSTNVVNMPAGVPRQGLGFAASTLRIDNITHQWYWVPSTQQWIAPGQVGVVIRLDQIQDAEVQALTPTGQTSAPVTGEFATAIFEQSRFEPTPGYNVFNGLSLSPDTPSDEEANQPGSPVVSFNKIWNSTASLWQRMRSASADALSATIAPLATALMGFNGTTPTASWDRLRSGDPVNDARGASQTNTGFLKIMSMLAASANGSSIQAIDAGSTLDARNGNGFTAVAQYADNGTTWDRLRNNLAVTLAALAARTTTLTVANQTNFNGAMLHVIVNVTVIPSGGLTVVINGVDLLGNAYPLLNGTKITATGIVVFKVGPGFGQIAGGAAADMLPRTWNVIVTPDDATSITYSVTANVNE